MACGREYPVCVRALAQRELTPNETRFFVCALGRKLLVEHFCFI